MVFSLREKLAEVQHVIWSHWMKYMFSIGYCRDIEFTEGVPELCWIMPNDKLVRWKRQMKTGYSDLSEVEKESDREQADRTLSVIQADRSEG